MQITICSSVDFSPKIIEVKSYLESKNCTVNIPYFTQKMIDGTLSFDDYLAEKNSQRGDIDLRQSVQADFIRIYWDYIRASDAILVLNLTKNNIDHYIGGSTFMEIGFAYGHGKTIFLYNPIPARSERMHYVDELIYMKPRIIHGDLTQIV